MTSITVVFKDAWLTDMTDTSVSIHASFPDRSKTASTGGAVREYAGGRRRIISNARKAATFPLVLQLLDDADLEQLIAWQDHVVLLRDPVGRRIFGAYSSVDVDDIFCSDGTLHNVTLTLVEVDFVEGVA
jgi:hypothetical protein